MAKLLSTTFKSLKPHSNPSCSLTNPKKSSRISISPSPGKSSPSASRSERSSWVAYLILSTNPPIKTYVGVTNNFPRRLKQHNGKLKGGAKASRVGRPWVCACLIQGFGNRSKACEFESKWKNISRKLPRKRSSSNENEEQASDSQHLLLRHRYAALNQVKDLIDCSHLEINWLLDPV